MWNDNDIQHEDQIYVPRCPGDSAYDTPVGFFIGQVLFIVASIGISKKYLGVLGN